MVSILFLAANPTDSRRLELEQEFQRIRAAIQSTRLASHIALYSRWDVRPDQLLQLLDQYRPQIVHFSGHGTDDGELRLQGRQGETRLVSTETLARVFRVAGDPVRLVLLNACSSRSEGQLVSEVVDCVIAMSQQITDAAATLFSEDFYRALGNGSDVERAFDHARLQVELSGLPEQDTPQLFPRPTKSPRDLSIEGLDPAPPPPIAPPPIAPPPEAVRPTTATAALDRPTVRRLLQKKLPDSGLFDAFLADYFADVSDRYGPGIDRAVKETLLLKLHELDEIVAAVEKHLAG
jgi:hypothetical protein